MEQQQDEIEIFLQNNQLQYVKTKLSNLGIVNKLEINRDDEYVLYFDSYPVEYIRNELLRLSFKSEYISGPGPVLFFLKKYKRTFTFDLVAYYIRLLSFVLIPISITLYCLCYFFEILLIGCINNKFACRFASL